MPRSGVNGTYTLPPNTDNQQPLTPISSSMFNAAMDDVEQTFNTPTPISYGGTGATSESGARESLGALAKDASNVGDTTAQAAFRAAVGAQVAEGTTAKSSAYTVTTADDQKIILCSASSAAFTVTLPAAATAGDGFVVTIKKTDSSTNAVTVDGDGSETIDGASTFTVSLPSQSVTLICDGSNWRIKSNDVLAALGVGQTWQNMTASRALNTNYVNNTGRPIVVGVTIGSGSPTSTLDLRVDGVSTTIPAGEGSYRLTATAIVPAGATYNAVRTGSTALSHWAELR